MRYEEVLEILTEIACGSPEEWDNSGVQINPGEVEVSCILTCLDVTPTVVDEAVRLGADMIVSHHPLLFGGLTRLDVSSGQEAMVMNLVEQGIAVYAAHMTFDKAPQGNSWYLADLLGLENIYQPGAMDNPQPWVVGDLPEATSLGEWCVYLEDMMNLSRGQLRFAGDPALSIEKVALCAGSGGDFMAAAMAEGCQVLLTGDVKYHEAMEARLMGFALVDAGHYGTEKYFAENMADQLLEKLDDTVEVLVSTENTDPFVV